MYVLSAIKKNLAQSFWNEKGEIKKVLHYQSDDDELFHIFRMVSNM